MEGAGSAHSQRVLLKGALSNIEAAGYRGRAVQSLGKLLTYGTTRPRRERITEARTNGAVPQFGSLVHERTGFHGGEMHPPPCLP